MGNNKIVGAVAAVIILAALSSLYVSLIGLGPRLDSRPHEALGQAMAREAVKHLGPGGRILLVRRDTRLFPNPATDVQMRSFHRELRKTGASVALTNVVKIDPLRLVSVPSGDYFQLLKKASESDVVVSFLGPPVLDVAQLAKLGDKRPKVVALCSGDMPRQVDLKRAFGEKLLRTAILSRHNAAEPSGLPATDNPGAWFNLFFMVATPENFAELLPQSGQK